MREEILNDIIVAMKSRDAKTLSVLRMVKGSMQLAEINKHHELDDSEMTELLAKELKSRNESLVEFEKANRADLVASTKDEIAIINKYMPVLMSKEAINETIDHVFKEVKPTSNKDIGLIMKTIMPLVKGKADMSLVNQMIKERISKLDE